MLFKKQRRVRKVFDNSIDAFIPEVWANESLVLMEENKVVAGLVHRDFEDKIANFGDTVNTRMPATFTAKRKGVNDNVTVQNASATNVAVVLDQQIHVSFLIRDGEQSKSFADLSRIYLRPAVMALTKKVDQVLLGQAIQYRDNFGGNLRGITGSNAKDYILQTREAMNMQNVPMEGRNLILSPSTETSVLSGDTFTAADKLGDAGTAIREASLGRRLGFDIYMCQNASQISVGNTTLAGAVNVSGGYLKGRTAALVVDGFSGAVVTGGWLTIAGDDTPHRITAHTETSSNTTGITLADGLRRDVANDAVITTYTPGAVNLSGGYAAGYDKEIAVDGFTVAPKLGQLVSFGTASAVYTIIGSPTTTSIELDRPLEAAIADDAVVGIGPAGNYNFAFHRNALALVVRPFALPMAGTGARAAVMSMNDMSIRVTFTYDGNKQGHLVTLDLLAGVKVLDTDAGALLLA